MSPVRKGEPWGEPPAGSAPVVVHGDDAALAAAVAAHDQGTRLTWHPTADADFARVIGTTGDDDATLDLPCDAIVVTPLPPAAGFTGSEDLRPRTAVNMVVFGRAPNDLRWASPSHPTRVVVDGRLVHDGPTTGVVVANGQFRRGADVVPRGHPGDGRIEVQVYAVPRGQRRALRQRLRTGSHVPHPGIRQAAGRSIEVTAVGARPGGGPLELDGAGQLGVGGFRAEVRDRAFVLVV